MELTRKQTAMFTVANLYYNQPILHVRCHNRRHSNATALIDRQLQILAQEFNVDYETSSRIATLTQAGYAGGLLLICPLADIVRRRPMVLLLIFLTANLVRSVSRPDKNSAISETNGSPVAWSLPHEIMACLPNIVLPHGLHHCHTSDHAATRRHTCPA